MSSTRVLLTSYSSLFTIHLLHLLSRNGIYLLPAEDEDLVGILHQKYRIGSKK